MPIIIIGSLESHVQCICEHKETYSVGVASRHTIGVLYTGYHLHKSDLGALVIRGYFKQLRHVLLRNRLNSIFNWKLNFQSNSNSMNSICLRNNSV